MDRSIAARQRRDEQVKERIAQKLVDSGEKGRLKELLREKLAACGWRDEMKAYCKGSGCLQEAGLTLGTRANGLLLVASVGGAEVIRNKGIDQVTVEDLVEEITPKGRGASE